MSSRTAAGPVTGIRFAFGTLTVLPVRVTRWDREAARAGMLCAPVAGLIVGLCAAVAGALLLVAGAGPLLAAVATAAVPAVLTRGLHLDGLADTADGLGSGKPAADALRIMKQSDIGPFGVITLVFTLLAQVAALAELYGGAGRDGGDWAWGAGAAVLAGMVARLALTLASRVGVPAARPEGLGAVVAATVPGRAAAAAVLLILAAVAGVGVGSAALSGAAADPLGRAVAAVVAASVALLVAELLLRRCVRRFGGVTGDVFGAVEETAATTALVALAAL
ncbi:adenosylcobinamide-GDP ribazoletransferase [Streptomyces sp. NPDC127084]|uniref:adenosylcobinamide-GDP ribazoletransferase n=1 Tax=Streptomyces sp. NPDC127084 TaxID=3347133 RepID=UPI003662FDB8